MSVRRNAYDGVKRGVDIVGAGLGLIALAPAVGTVAILVRIKLGSPVIFKQQRPGRDGEVFTLYKFRSMLEVDKDKGLTTNEQRMTQFGQKLRSTSMDELPSLVNVVKGEMSLVGPRPLLVEYLDRYTFEQARRHEVRPGITGLAQVNGRNHLEWTRRLALDVEYVDNRSPALDMKIIAKTLTTAVQRKGITSQGHIVGVAFSGNKNKDKDATVAKKTNGGPRA